ncbi:hypothetical protein [Leptotrichia hofstadii]|uniref:Lipoprotein n=1 Tax=Leptotrichia hofstadii F0254 TaxID=634994 RepID=C9MYC4_9FUSO|nr:hypothetical protein [Leptotrichia hofstadii]EEX74504.1 hypothetical protein GCWU000323_01551 [Leptotrichia hofstadii F0254]
MKKILTLAFLVIGATTFSAGCDWFKGNTKYADKMVELVKKEGLTSKVYCDMDQKKWFMKLCITRLMKNI